MNMLDEVERGGFGAGSAHGADDPRLLDLVTKRAFVLACVLGALGLLALAAPWTAAHIVDVICGITLLVAGVGQLVLAAGAFTWRGFWVTLLCGALSVVAGVAMLVLPKAGVEALVTFLGCVLLLESVAKLAAAFAIRRGAGNAFPWGWMLFDGLVTGALGSVLVAGAPATAGVLLGVFVGMNLLSSAVTFATVGLGLRRVAPLME